MFISCPDPECFAGFDAIFVPKLLSKDAPKLDAIIIDVGCRYEAHFKYHHEVVSAQVPHVFVGWLHSNAGHNLSCQLKFCGMYHEGMGRCIGEQTEQLWVSLCNDAHSVSAHNVTSRIMDQLVHGPSLIHRLPGIRLHIQGLRHQY